jgi:hypothetical protein
MLAVGLVMVILVLSCKAMVRDCNDAQEELKAGIAQFYRVALSVRGTGGDAAHIVHRRAQPFRYMLEEAEDDAPRVSDRPPLPTTTTRRPPHQPPQPARKPEPKTLPRARLGFQYP